MNNELEILYYAQKATSYFDIQEKFGFKSLGEVVDFINSFCKKYGFYGDLPLKIPAKTWEQIVKDLGGDINKYPPLQPQIQKPQPTPTPTPTTPTLNNQQLLELLYMAQQVESLNELCDKFGVCAMTDLIKIINGLLRQYKIYAVLPLNIPPHIWQKIVRDLGGDINKYPSLYKEPEIPVFERKRFGIEEITGLKEKILSPKVKNEIKRDILKRLRNRPDFIILSQLNTLIASYNISEGILWDILYEMEGEGTIEIVKNDIVKIFKGINPKILEGTRYEVLIPWIHEAQRILNIPVEIIEPVDYTKISHCWGSICYFLKKDRDFEKIYISGTTKDTEEQLVYQFHKAVGKAMQYHFPEFAKQLQEAIGQMSEEDRARILGEEYRYPVKDDPNGEFFEAGAEAYAIFRTDRSRLPIEIQKIIDTHIMSKITLPLLEKFPEPPPEPEKPEEIKPTPPPIIITPPPVEETEFIKKWIGIVEPELKLTPVLRKSPVNFSKRGALIKVLNHPEIYAEENMVLLDRTPEEVEKWIKNKYISKITTYENILGEFPDKPTYPVKFIKYTQNKEDGSICASIMVYQNNNPTGTFLIDGEYYIWLTTQGYIIKHTGETEGSIKNVYRCVLERNNKDAGLLAISLPLF